MESSFEAAQHQSPAPQLADVPPRQRRRAERDAYADVGRALRRSISQALEVGEGLTREARVLLAVYDLTAAYSRVSDRIYVAQLADIASIRGDVDDRHLRRALKRWHERGVIWWEPAAAGKGRGNGRASTVSLLPPATTRPLLAVARETRPDPVKKPGQIRTENPATSGPPPEKLPEVTETEDESSVRGREPREEEESLSQALDDEFGRAVTRSDHGRRGEVLRQLRDIDATGDDVRAVVRAFRRMWPAAHPTDSAIVKHWGQLIGKASYEVGTSARKGRQDSSRSDPVPRIGECFVCEREREVRYHGGQWFCEDHLR